MYPSNKQHLEGRKFKARAIETAMTRRRAGASWRIGALATFERVLRERRTK